MIKRLNTPLVRRYLSRLVKGRSDLVSASTRIDVIEKSESVTIRAAMFPEDSLNKIVAISPWRNKDTDYLLANGGHWTCPPTTCYSIPNVSIARGFIYKGSASQNEGTGRQHLWSDDFKHRDVIDRGNMVSTWSGNNYFGSLLLDDYPLELISDNIHDNIRVCGKQYHHDSEYRKLLGIGASKLTKFALVRHFTLYEDATHNKNKAQRYRVLRKNLRASLSGQLSKSADLVYLKRGYDGDQRDLVNEKEFADVLRRSGFDVVDTVGLSPSEIAIRTMDASVVVGIEGSHLSHGIFSMAESGTLLVVQPPDRFSMVYKEFTDCMQMRFAFILADSVGPGSYKIDVETFKELLERINVMSGN